MNIIKLKQKQRNFTIIDNAIFDDSRLRFHERGLLTQLLSKPEDWKVSTKNLAKMGGVGLDAVRMMINRLIECGYIVRTKVKDQKGHFHTEYMVYEVPLHHSEKIKIALQTLGIQGGGIQPWKSPPLTKN